MMIKQCPGYEDKYLISDTGVVIFCHGHKPGIITGSQFQSGYHRYNLQTKSGKFKSERTHRLVALAFIGNAPKDKPYINHKDGNKLNNRSDNLEWMSNQENITHRIIVLGQTGRGEKGPNSKLNKQEVIDIRALYAEGFTQSKIAARYDVTQTCISLIIRKKTWSES